MYSQGFHPLHSTRRNATPLEHLPAARDTRAPLRPLARSIDSRLPIHLALSVQMGRRSASPRRRSASRSRSRSPSQTKSRRERSRSRSVSKKRHSRSPSRSRERGRGRDSSRRGRSSRSRSRDRGDSRRSRSRSRGRGDSRGGRDSYRPVPQSLLVRNLGPHTTADSLRRAFSRRPGDIRDVYLPKDYSTNEPRGFAFIEYVFSLYLWVKASCCCALCSRPCSCTFCRFGDSRDAREVKYQMDRSKLEGREIAVLFAQQKRKSPEEMRADLRQQQEQEAKRRAYVRSCSCGLHATDSSTH